VQSARPPKRIFRFNCGRYFARTIRREDTSERWASWLSDPWAMHTLNTPPRQLQKSDIVEFIKQFDQRSRLLLGIFERGTLRHIGIIRLDVDYTRGDALVSVLIERGYRGTGVQLDVFTSMLDSLFDTLKVNRFRANILERNQVSMRYLLKIGWQVDQTAGHQIKSASDSSVLNVLSLILTRADWEAWKKTPVAKRLARRIRT
jgi:RimJ/RimL family protein N-acetyltransferase